MALPKKMILTAVRGSFPHYHYSYYFTSVPANIEKLVANGKPETSLTQYPDNLYLKGRYLFVVDSCSDMSDPFLMR
jgi:hypothetical protein